MVDDAVVGRQGSVTVRIRGADGPGEVSVAVRGGSESFIAYSLDQIEVGATVLVLSSRGSRSVDVVAWP